MRPGYIIAAALCCLAQSPAIAAPSLCATPEQAATVQSLYLSAPVPPTFMAATRLGLSEAVVASALAGKQTIGTGGAGFAAIWESIRAWGDATVVLVKGGQVFEVHGPVPAGAPSTTSQFFNLAPDGPGLGGHLRPDLIGAIYAVDLAGAQGPVRGVTFVDTAGDSIFGVYLPEAAKPGREQLAAFDRTRAVIRSLPRVCS